MTTAENLVAAAQLTDAELRQIQTVLHSILDSSQFRKSKRYPAFLEFIVQNTLKGNLEALKERTLGAEVFERPADWDTGNDSIVRNAAVEVRKRMALYYSEHPGLPVRIELPPGSYVAEFYFRTSCPSEADSNPVEAHASASHQNAPDTQSASLIARLRRLARLLLIAFCLILAAALIGLWAWWHHQQAEFAFWQPLLNNNRPILLVSGGAFDASIPTSQPYIDVAGAPIPLKEPQSNTNWLLNDPVWVARICNAFLHFNKSGCAIVTVSSLQTSDLSQKNVIVLGSTNNPLTDQLLSSLRFQFRTSPRVETLPHQERMIVDQFHPEAVSTWKIAHDPPSTMHDDYAIVARFNSPLTNGPVILIAGMRPEGTSGAGEFITSHGAYQKILAMAPGDWKGTEFEAVLKVEPKEGTNVDVKILATQFW